MKPLSPFILQAQIAPPATGGSFGLADTTRLENPFNAPMWIDEIRFRLPETSGVTKGSAWSRLRVELKLGDNTPLTNGFVPISLLGKVLTDSDVVGEGGSPDVFTWKLPKPLWIPAREFLRPTIYYETFPSAPARTVTIIYCCRPVPKGTPPPSVLQIPWVTYFKPAEDAITAMEGGTDQTNSSTPSDLYNPWDEELHVQRFIGRLMGRYNASDEVRGSFAENAYMSLASANVNLTTGLVTTGTLVSAQDSFNNILIRDVTPFAHVFCFVDRSWTVNCRLPPKGYYLLTVDRLWAAYRPADDIHATVGISMVGWREVKVRQHRERPVGVGSERNLPPGYIR